MLTNDFEDSSPAATAAEIAGLRATFDNGEAIDVIAACALLSIEDAEENDRRRRRPQGVTQAATPAGPRPTRNTSTSATVTDAGRARVREIAARANAADVRSALLTEISRKHGAAVVDACKSLTLDELLAKVAQPTRAAISASWDRVFVSKGIELHAGDDPAETPIQQSSTRALRRVGAPIPTTAPVAKANDRHGWQSIMDRKSSKA
jgi:hypothetical protein